MTTRTIELILLLLATFLFVAVVKQPYESESRQSQVLPSALTIEEALRSAKTGDLMIDNDGRVSFVAETTWSQSGPESIIKNDIFYPTNTPTMLSGNEKIEAVAKKGIRVVSKHDKDYGLLANCLLQGKRVKTKSPTEVICK